MNVKLTRSNRIKLTFWQRIRLKRPARRILARSYTDSGGSIDRANQLFKTRCRDELKLDPVTILLLVRILTALLQFWFATRTANPNSPSEKEPKVNWNLEINA